MIDEKKMLDQLDFHANDALFNLTDGESDPKTCIDLLDAACFMATFCVSVGLNIPLKYRSTLFKVRGLYLEMHPELFACASSLLDDGIRSNISSEETERNGSLIRIALEYVFGLEVKDSSGLRRNEELEKQFASSWQNRSEEAMLSEVDRLLNE